jgi:imidazole glycerol-phosphate synthase subunit HisH
MLTIVDYQMGNLRSVQKAIEKVGGSALISSDPKVIASADRLILPGVGAFGDCMDELKRRDLVSPIRDFVASGRPFLGICLGLQLLFDESEESPGTPGLGILPGRVVRFPDDGLRKVPHMGWNTVRKVADAPALCNIADGTYFYFVHSYYVQPADESIDALRCDYGVEFTAAVWKDNLFATQFHPEKSQSDGMKLLQGFLQSHSLQSPTLQSPPTANA